MHYNGFITFVCSLVPGGGQMYLGYRIKGFQLMAVFFALFAATTALDVASIGVSVLLLIWFYSYFDTILIRRALRMGQPVEDKGFIDLPIDALNGYHIGIACIIIGIFLALRGIENTLSMIFGPSINLIIQQLRSYLPSALLVLVGLYLIQNRKK